MKPKLLSIVLANVFMAATVAAFAQGGMGKGHNLPDFSDCDLNGDGVITSDEFYEARGKRMAEQAAKGGQMKNAANAPSFEDIDKNDDGKIDEAEFDAHKAAMIEKHQNSMKND